MEQKLWKNNLKQLRLERGYSQQQVAELIGLKCQNRLCRWEKGISIPSLQNLVRLAQVYQLEIAKLYD